MKTAWLYRRLALVGLVVLCLMAASRRSNAAEELTEIDPRGVQLAGEIGRRYALTIDANLRSIDHDRDFLRYFRERGRAPFSYVGLGKQLDAVVRFAHATGDERLMKLKQHLVAETIKTQSDDGYIGIFADQPAGTEPPELGEGPRLVVWWDIHELSYIILGLVADYECFENEQALAAARRAADYIIERRPAVPLNVHVYTTGLEQAFLALASATGDEKYRDYVNHQQSLAKWRADVSGHAYNYMNVCLAQLRLADDHPELDLRTQSRELVEFLRQEGGLLISGSCSRNEGWHTDQLDTGKTAETCATAYLIRLLHHLMLAEADAATGDLMERAMFNALFAAQSPDGRELRKYCPLTGGREFYQGEPSSDFKRDTYCCPNNFRRIIAELPRMIYYQDADGLTVNQYTESEAEFAYQQVPVAIRQSTDYPSSGKIAIVIEPARELAMRIRLRVPGWCEQPAIQVNGEQVEEAPPDGYVGIARTWRNGDRIEIDFPMKPRLIAGRGVNDGRVALLYGPTLFCLNPSRQTAGVEQAAEDVVLAFDQLVGPLADDSIRPGGLAFKVPVVSGATGQSRMLLLTEFTDPGGEATFFRATDGVKSRADELFQAGQQQRR